MVKNSPANAGDRGLIPGSGRSPEDRMATHSSVLAWRIPGTREPGELPSMGSYRVGHDLATKYGLPYLHSITLNKASGGDGIPVELFQILKDDAVTVLHSICQHM